MSRSSRPVLNPNEVGLFIGFNQCPRYLTQSFGQVSGNRDELGVFLSEIGGRFEDDTLDELRGDAAAVYDGGDWEISDDPDRGQREIVSKLEEIIEDATAAAPVLIGQPPVRGTIGAWDFKGRGDMLALWKASNGIIANVFEIKASHELQPYHQIQAGIYSLLYEQILEDIAANAETRISVVHRGTDDIDLTAPNTIPTIDEPDVVRNDIERLLRDGGTIDAVYEADDVNYSLTGKCNTCLYNEECFKHSLDTRNLALLGLTEGEQRILHKHGIEDIEDLAALKENIDDPKPYEYDEFPSRDDDTVRALLNEPSIGTRIDKMVQRAQSMLAGVKSQSAARADPQANEGPLWQTPLQGSGKSSLPSTNPSPGQRESMSYNPDDMIRVYLYVREDFARDTLGMLAGRVARNSSSLDPQSFSVVADRLPDNDKREEVLDAEGNLLSEFFTELFKTIDRVAEDDDEAVTHVYFFSRMERDALVDAILRQMPRYDRDSYNAVRDILGYREAIDQPMVSIVQDELQDRFALRYPGSGILPALEQAQSNYCDCGCDGRFRKSDWSVSRSDNSMSFNCWDTFKFNFFNYQLPVESDRHGYLHPDLDTESPEDYYPLRARFDNQIPLEYIWASKGKLDSTWADSDQQKREIRKYRYHDHQKQKHRITPEDVGLFGEKLCHALHHLEACVGNYQNPFLGKEAISLPELPTFNLGDIDLARSLSDYLDLEHYADRQQKYREYAKSPRERVQSGYAAIVEIDTVDIDNGDLIAEGDLIYDRDEFNDPDQIAYACRLKGSEDDSSGSHRVANAVEWDSDEGVHRDKKSQPAKIESGLPVEVEEINLGSRRITFKSSDFHTKDNFIPNFRQDDYEYVHTHDVWTDDPAEAGVDHGRRIVYFEKGDRYILDQKTDDWTADHAQTVLTELEDSRPGHNPRYHYYHVLNRLVGGVDE